MNNVMLLTIKGRIHVEYDVQLYYHVCVYWNKFHQNYVFVMILYCMISLKFIDMAPAIKFLQIPGEMVNQVRYLYESETATKKAKNIKDVKKMLNRRTKSHSNITKEVQISPLFKLQDSCYISSTTG